MSNATLCSSPLRAASNILLASAIASGGSSSAERGPPFVCVCGGAESMAVDDRYLIYPVILVVIDVLRSGAAVL